MRKTEMREVEVEVFTICDKCGCNADDSVEDEHSLDCSVWEVRGYLESYITIGNSPKYKLDLCSNCIDEMIQLLKANGYDIRDSNE